MQFEKSPLPEFLVVGAAKSGTTSLWKYLSQHSEIYIPSIKEGRFFSQMPKNFKGGEAAAFQNDGPREINEYLNLYKGNENNIKGDISNDYLYYYERTIPFIKKVYADKRQDEPKIIIILRNPIARVFSMYHHIIRLGSDVIDFKESFDLSSSRIQDGYAWMFDLAGVGKSYDPSKAYIDSFNHVKVFITEDMGGEMFMHDLLAFIGADKSISLDMSQVFNSNTYIAPKNMMLNKILNSWAREMKRKMPKQISYTMTKYFKPIHSYINKLNSGALSELNEDSYKFLEDYYRDEIIQLQGLLGRDLSNWLNRKHL